MLCVCVGDVIYVVFSVCIVRRGAEDTESAFVQITIPTNIHTANIIFTNIILMADKHYTKGQDA